MPQPYLSPIKQYTLDSTRGSVIVFLLSSLKQASYPQSEVSRIITSKSGIFLDFQDRMLHWMNRNYSRILDLFRRFDSDNSGTISYEEFAAGMRDLGK